MATKPKGRPALFRGKAGHVTILLPDKTIARINRMAGAAPGNRAATLRRLIDAGLAVQSPRARGA